MQKAIEALNEGISFVKNTTKQSIITRGETCYNTKVKNVSISMVVTVFRGRLSSVHSRQQLSLSVGVVDCSVCYSPSPPCRVALTVAMILS